MAFPVCSARCVGLAALLGQSPGCARGAELALALLCCVPAEQVTVGRWTPGLSADHEDVTAMPVLQRTQPKRPKVVTF